MKKTLLLAVSVLAAQIIGMEKEQTFTWEQLLPELKTEVIKAVATTNSMEDAIKALKNLQLGNKQWYAKIMNDKATIFCFFK